MNMATCYIVDDEIAAIDVIRNYIGQTDNLTLIDSFTNPVEALKAIKKQPADVIFLDINMPNISGLDFVNLLPEEISVIFTTAYPDYALDGYEHNAVDYLLKPVAYDRFLKAVDKFGKLTNNANAPKAEPINGASDYIFVKTDYKGKFIKVNFNDIIYVEGLKNYLSIYTGDEQRIITMMSMKEMEEVLPKTSFLRVHKSYLVSFDRIKAVDGNQILLTNQKAYIPLGEGYRKVFFDTLREKIHGGKRV
ncbi:LytR/AlgR family response regulator transcription factor [Fibrella sp. WM1]|uniref:LytR/AlgR family response regulator transcription factor n=1 Tax=Fibrella musci TaxID=3242485 RepID=UPI00351F9A78